MTAQDPRLDALRSRLESALADGVVLRRDENQAVLVDFGETPASVQVFELARDVDVYSLTQVVAWDLALTDELRDDVRTVAEGVQFGSLRLMEREVSADLVLHYSFPAGTLAGEALREFVLFVLAQGVDARRRLVG
ncbi:hypothetical protein [Tsukamurella paurometabola]|uniref:Sensory transduction regulator n=1 Tax=Tsukamurella paurometabola TaxID=2061 RepID=A0A3P8MD57_TSUPA|nr:hypothetical protein [Tsukamurella paurometabola]MBS4101056.1 hypothetical protein [Tsukamurella paurometabola]UEA82918.1 hypothetical protein LK411_21570 [Tsukamurella paurometabola]VDR39996.1 Uncharacterised protein [Tsukamurella paurometabola]